MSYRESALRDPSLLEATIDVLEDAFPQSPADAVSDLGSIITSAIVEYKERFGTPVGTKVSISLNGGWAVANIVLDGVDHGDWYKAIVTNLAGLGAGVLGQGAVGILLVGAGPVTAVAAGDFASELLTNSLGEIWPYWFGPNMDAVYDPIRDRLTMTTHDPLGTTLALSWQEVETDTVNLKLLEVPRWTLQSHNADEPLKLSFDSAENLFDFDGVTGPPTLPFDCLDDLYLYSNEEHHNLVKEVLRYYVEDFNVVVNGQEDFIYNFSSPFLYNLQTDIMDDQVTFWAAQELKPYVARDYDRSAYESVDPSEFSEQYKLDRAKYLYYLNNGAMTAGPESIEFHNERLGSDYDTRAQGSESGIDILETEIHPCHSLFKVTPV